MIEMPRIAMWSGPRNLSTALMRSFSSRLDCEVMDEPFYAAYLNLTGLNHPMRSEILMGEKDANKVAGTLRGPLPSGQIQYQKHMLQHMIKGVPRDWMEDVQNIFLIRDPARVLASYQAKREEVSAQDLGIPQQMELFNATLNPIVIDSADILKNPKGMLETLCERLSIPFDPAMLRWKKGPHPSDGIWGEHWYGAIWASTGFSKPKETPRPEIDRPDIMDPGLEIYEAMRAVRLTSGEKI